MKMFPVTFRRILEIFTLQGLKIVLGTFSQFLHPKTKLFPVEFRRSLEVLQLKGLQKMSWVYFHNLCIQKQSCFL